MSISGNSFRYFDRTANVSFNEDVDLMIYHYLQYNAAKTALAALRMRLPQQARTASLILGSYDGASHWMTKMTELIESYAHFSFSQDIRPSSSIAPAFP